MKTINEQCIYTIGPYEGYCGRAQYDAQARIFHGEVVGIRDVVTFQGRTPADLKTAFTESVDDYLEFCKSRRESPEKPFSGKLLTRMDPDLHRKVSMMADLTGKSLNQLICEYLDTAVEQAVLNLDSKKPRGSAPSNPKRNEVKGKERTSSPRQKSESGRHRPRSKKAGREI